MAYTIISQNNNTTTLSDGVNTITVPSRVNLTSGNFTIVEVNNNMATLEDGDGNVYRDIPCVATLAGEGGGGGSGLPDQTGHSGEFLTTDGTDASWASVDALPDQTGHSGEFLTTDGTDASWGAISALQNTATGTKALTILGTANASTEAINIGIGSSSGGSNSTVVGNNASGSTAFGYGASGTCSFGIYASSTGGYTVSVGNNAKSSTYGTAIGGETQATGDTTVAIGRGAKATAKCAIMIGPWTNSNQDTLKIGFSSAAYELLSSDGTIPTARFTTDPSADGTYYPTLTISSGTPTRSWSTIAALQNKSKSVSGVIINEASIITGLNKDGTVGIGYGSATGMEGDVAIGYNAQTAVNSGYGSNVAVGAATYINGKRAIAIGGNAEATADHAIQIGSWGNGAATNSDANTVKIANANGNFMIMDANGNLPADRLASTTGLADGNYRLRLTMTNGVPTLSWVAE